MQESILGSIKKTLGLTSDYTAFDQEIVLHINSVFSTLHQLGVGPNLGYSIQDETNVWEEFLGDNLPLNAVRTYVYLRVRLLFDPPSNSFLVTAINEQIKELEWRLNVTRETTGTYGLPTIDGGYPDRPYQLALIDGSQGGL